MRAVLIFAPLFLAACSEAPVPVVYQHDQCHRLKLVDAANGTSIRGAEDIASLPGGDLLISAYDRRMKDRDGKPPEGGVYYLSKRDLDRNEATVTPILTPREGGLRPHGIAAHAIDKETARVAVVNRAWVSSGDDRPSEEPEILTFAFRLPEREAGPVLALSDDRFCRANDLAFRDQDTLEVTIDRNACSGFASFYENVLRQEKGRILTLDLSDNAANVVGTLDSTLAFPNGIGTKSLSWEGTEEDQYVAVAETRGNRIRFYPFADDPEGRWDPVTLPGSPDNITVGKPGLILAALHPNLVTLALYRYDWPFFETAPSRIVKITGTQVLTLFDDPSGEVFSAASVAVHTFGKLVIGSVGDDGVLVWGVNRSTAQSCEG
ncbi:MAG: hypothetical protein AAGE89_03440 [Pseudomonadota bacterium]